MKRVTYTHTRCVTHVWRCTANTHARALVKMISVCPIIVLCAIRVSDISDDRFLLYMKQNRIICQCFLKKIASEARILFLATIVLL